MIYTIYLKSGQVIRVPLISMTLERNIAHNLCGIKWIAKVDAPMHLEYLNVSEVVAITMEPA